MPFTLLTVVIAMPFRALESTSLMPETRAETSVLLAVDAFEGAEVSSLIVLRTGDWLLSRTGASLEPVMLIVMS